MLPVLPLRLSSAASSALGSDWDVEEEIARELQGLRDDTNESLSAAESQEGSAAHLDAPTAAPIAALWSALAAREELADKLTATLEELVHLPVPSATQSSRTLTTASAQDISAAVAALQEVTEARSKGATAAANSLSSAPTPQTHPVSCGSAQPLGTGSTSSVQEVASDNDALLALQPAVCQLGMTQAGAGPADKLCAFLHPDNAVGCANAAQAAAVPAPKAHSVKQLLQDHASHSHGDFRPPSGNDHAAIPAASAAAGAPSQPQSRVQLTPPHTPKTEDKRQHGMAPLLASHHQQLQQEPSQQQAYLTCEPSSEATSMSGSTPSRSESGAMPAAAAATAAAAAATAAAAAAAAAVAAEQATAQAAAKQLLQQQLELEQTLRQRAAAAAAREAAQAAVRQKLQQQAEEAARSYMAAWRIARAWQAYRCSAAHTNKVAAVLVLQAAVRGVAARRLAGQLKRHRELLLALRDAERSGSYQAVQSAASAAAVAGLKLEVEHALQQYQSACQTAAQDLKQAAEGGNHAAFAAAAATASKLSALEDTCSTCLTRFQARQQAALQGLQAAVAKLPLQQVQCAVDAALELGVDKSELAAALEAARVRDEAAAVRLSGAVKALAAESAAVLTACSDVAYSSIKTESLAQATGSSGGPSSSTSSNRNRGGFDRGSFLDAVAACRQYGKVSEAAAGEALLQQCQQQAAQVLARQACHSASASVVQQLLCWCGRLGGLQQECTAAARQLQERQQQLAASLQALLQEPSSAAASVQDLLKQARQLGVDAHVLAEADRQLHDKQAAAQQQCWDVARTGTLQQLQHATAAALQQGVCAAELQPCQGLMHERQQQAARGLAGVAAALCTASERAARRASADPAGCPELGYIQQQHSQVGSSKDGAFEMGQSGGSISDSCAAPQQHRSDCCTRGLRVQLQELMQHAVACKRLGLHANVAAAVQAVTHPWYTQQLDGAGVVASCSVLLDTAGSCGQREPTTSSHNSTDVPTETGWLWEEGSWRGLGWDSADTAHLPSGRTQQPPDLGDMGSAQPASTTAEPTFGFQHENVLPELFLQRHWAANLLAALAEEDLAIQRPPIKQSESGSSSSSSRRHKHDQQQCQPAMPQAQQDQHAHNNWLQRLLAANSAAPLNQLTQLDLSLEQLPGLHGLDALCPQLTRVAVNMNGLKTLEGLQGCSALVHLSAQDNQLQHLPDISCHPQLTALLLDSNLLSEVAATASSSSSRACMPLEHRHLQILSLTSNHLTSLCSSAVPLLPTQQATAMACNTHSSHDDTSSSSSSSSCVPRTMLLSSWLPCLQTLRLSGNQLCCLTGLQGCSSLRTLDVSRNHITDLQGLSGCHLLQHLDASENRLASFAGDVHLPLLQHLNLSSNAFSGWPSLPPLPHLRHLSLADNQLQRLPHLLGMLQLKHLDLAFNALEDLAACIAALQPLPQLLELQLHDNSFHLHLQDLQGAQGPVWADLAAAGAAHAAAAYEAWYRQQVSAGLPWLLKLDSEEVDPAERLACQGQPAEPLRQQQLQRGLQHLARSSSGSLAQQLSQRVAAGQLIASSALPSMWLLRQLRAGCIGGLGVALQAIQTGPAAAAAAGSDGHPAAIRDHTKEHATAAVAAVVAAQSAAALLFCPYGWQLSGSPQLLQQWKQLQSSAAPAAATSSVALVPDQCDSRMPCTHLQQALGHLQQAPRCSTCCRSTGDSSSTSVGNNRSIGPSVCSCPAWLRLVEVAWCYSTRAWLVELQARQQAGCQHCPRHLQLARAGSSICTSEAPAGAAVAGDAIAMARQHLLQLRHQPCHMHQQQLEGFAGFNGAWRASVAAAAVLLQSSWRARVVRMQYRQQLQEQRQQQHLADAAVVLQSLWRARQCRLAVKVLQRQQAEAAGVAAAAAAVRIQAAVRGHKVRQRLRAALAAARAAAPHHPNSRNAQSQQRHSTASAAAGAVLESPGSSVQGVMHMAAPSDSVAASDDDEWDLDGVPDNFVCLPEELLNDDLLLPGSGLGMQPQQKEQLTGLRGSTPLEPGLKYSEERAGGMQSCRSPVVAVQGASQATRPALTADGPVTGPAGAAAADALRDQQAEGMHGTASSSPCEAKITALMAEWGFTDRATAEAYYKRQKHTLKAVTKHKLQQQLKDPTVRLNRLRAQLGSSAAPATRPAAKTNSTVPASCSAANGGRAGRRVSAEKPKHPGGGSHGNSNSKATSFGNAACGPPGDQETQCHNSLLGPVRSCSQKQQPLPLPLALPSLAPSTKACKVTPSAASPASGVPRSLPKLVPQ